MPLHKRGWNWAPIPIDVVMSKALKDFDVRLYGYLLWRAGRKGTAWPGVSRIAEELGVDARTVVRSLKRLTADFWINRFRRFGRSSLTCVYEAQADCKAEREAGAERIGLKSPNRTVDEEDLKVVSNRTLESSLNESKINESKLKPSAAQKPRVTRPLTPFQENCKQLECLFSELSGLPAPDWDKLSKKQRAGAAVRWGNPIGGFVKLANGQSAEIMKSAFKEQRDAGLDISAPQSIENKFKSVYSKRLGKATGSTNGPVGKIYQ